MSANNWAQYELLAAFNLYCRTPFGRLHKGNSEIIELAQKLGRTPSAVAMKLVNFASLDPAQQARNIRGLSNASRSDQELWEAFNSNPEEVAFESQRAFEKAMLGEPSFPDELDKVGVLPSGPTEALRTVRTRLVQRFFRDSVLTSYDYQCAICQLNLKELLTASHIIPWSQSVERRADPKNGLCLCALHDRAFDRGLLTIDEAFAVLLSPHVKTDSLNRMHQISLSEFEGNSILMPKRFAPDPIALAYHREHIFRP